MQKNLLKTQFLGVVEFHSIFEGSGFSFQFLKNYYNLSIFLSDFEFYSGMLLPQK